LKIVLTGAAGFIGFHTAQALLKAGHEVIGIDNVNAYYIPELKRQRLKQLEETPNFTFCEGDITDSELMGNLRQVMAGVTHVLHLAAQAGVRYSLQAPFKYTESNVTGQLVMLELCRLLPSCKHFVYASSSSVYGANTKIPFSIQDPVDQPVSLYAATKRSGELMAQTYSRLYDIPATGLRFFTVYGPWGRPDMAYFSFVDKIMKDKPITLFNHGKMQRDFTYIDDIVDGVIAALGCKPEGDVPHQLFNLGNHKPENLGDFVAMIEQAVGKKAIIQYDEMQLGDVVATYADITESKEKLGFEPKISMVEGIPKFVEWYKGWVDG
jgi:UDP-glucuronate 4-epimerase